VAKDSKAQKPKSPTNIGNLRLFRRLYRTHECSQASHAGQRLLSQTVRVWM